MRRQSQTVMQLETQRLIIRQWHPLEDVRNAMDIFGDARVARWLENDSQDASLRQVQGRLQRYADETRKSASGIGSWAVVQKDISRVIGHVRLKDLPDLDEVRSDHVPEPIADGINIDYVEMAWQLRPASWGFGYAVEAARALVEYGFGKLELPLLLAIAQPENRRAIAVIERLGMQYDGITTRCYGCQSLMLYRLSADRYQQQHQQQHESTSATAHSQSR